MTQKLDRRAFLGRTTQAALAMGTGTLLANDASAETNAAFDPEYDPNGAPKKSLLYGMLPGNMSMEDRFKLARDVGFAGVESHPITDLAEAEKMRKAAEKAGIHIHSVIFGGWEAPLGSNDPNVTARGLKNVEAALHGIKEMGGDSLLLVPAVVNAQTRYQDAYRNSQRNIRKLIPLAEKLQVRINVEEVWNNFLLSPMEFARYVDEFKSPWVQAYFDIGNVVAFAWPQDWIRTLGKRIRRMHLKDFKGGPGLGGAVGSGHFVNIRDGSIEWPEVRRAMKDIGYTGYITTELGGGDHAYLQDISDRFDKILAGV